MSKKIIDTPRPSDEQSAHLLLIEGTEQLGIKQDQSLHDQLWLFTKLLYKWNRTFNLTGAKSLREIAINHVLDSLSIWPYIKRDPVLDVGSGAGLPGVPLAIVLPKYTFVLVDSNAKKTRFMQQALIELNLKNVTVHHQRIEDFACTQPIGALLSRAVAVPEKLLQATQHLFSEHTEFFMMCGKISPSLVSPNGFTIQQQIQVSVPHRRANRNLLVIKQT